MSNAIVRKYTGVNFPDGKKLRRDQIMDDGFVGLLDFKSTYVMRDYNESSADQIHNLVDGAGTAHTKYDGMGRTTGGGLEQTATGESIYLPDEFKQGVGVAGKQHYLFTQWVSVDLASMPSSTVVFIGGYAYQTGGDFQYGSYLNVVDGVPELRFQVQSARYESPSLGAVVTDGNVHQIAVEFEATAADTFTRRYYFDGVKIHESSSGYSGELNKPEEVHVPRLGAAGGFPVEFKGVHYRTWLKDFEQSPNDTRTAEDIVAEEWALYKDRFI